MWLLLGGWGVGGPYRAGALLVEWVRAQSPVSPISPIAVTVIRNLAKNTDLSNFRYAQPSATRKGDPFGEYPDISGRWGKGPFNISQSKLTMARGEKDIDDYNSRLQNRLESPNANEAGSRASIRGFLAHCRKFAPGIIAKFWGENGADL